MIPRGLSDPLFHSSARSQRTQFDPEDFRAFILSHPSSQFIRWYRAFPDPTYDPTTTKAAFASGKSKWRRVEQTLQGDYRAIIRGGSAIRAYTQYAELPTGSVIITTMPDELPLGIADWVAPIGMGREFDPDSPDQRTYEYKETVTRGQDRETGAGTISSSGTAVTGTGTAFTSFLRVGDIVLAAGQGRRITAITDDTHLTVESSPSPVWNGNDYQRAFERLLYHPVVSLTTVEDAATAYTVKTDVTVDTDERSVRWFSASDSPAFGTRYGVTYRYLLKYQVFDDLTTQRQRAHGVALPQSVVATIWKPETHTE